jgi:excinuclease ABC subunit B
MTDSMKRAIEETNRRRAIQQQHNIEHHITPASIVKQVRDLTDRVRAMSDEAAKAEAGRPVNLAELPKDEIHRMIKELEREMKAAAQALEFEKAAALRDQMLDLRGALADKEAEKNILFG